MGLRVREPRVAEDHGSHQGQVVGFVDVLLHLRAVLLGDGGLVGVSEHLDHANHTPTHTPIVSQRPTCKTGDTMANVTSRHAPRRSSCHPPPGARMLWPGPWWRRQQWRPCSGHSVATKHGHNNAVLNMNTKQATVIKPTEKRGRAGGLTQGGGCLRRDIPTMPPQHNTLKVSAERHIRGTIGLGAVPPSHHNPSQHMHTEQV